MDIWARAVDQTSREAMAEAAEAAAGSAAASLRVRTRGAGSSRAAAVAAAALAQAPPRVQARMGVCPAPWGGAGDGDGGRAADVVRACEDAVAKHAYLPAVEVTPVVRGVVPGAWEGMDVPPSVETSTTTSTTMTRRLVLCLSDAALPGETLVALLSPEDLAVVASEPVAAAAVRVGAVSHVPQVLVLVWRGAPKRTNATVVGVEARVVGFGAPMSLPTPYPVNVLGMHVVVLRVTRRVAVAADVVRGAVVASSGLVPVAVDVEVLEEQQQQQVGLVEVSTSRRSRSRRRRGGETLALHEGVLDRIEQRCASVFGTPRNEATSAFDLGARVPLGARVRNALVGMDSDAERKLHLLRTVPREGQAHLVCASCGSPIVPVADVDELQAFVNPHGFVAHFYIAASGVGNVHPHSMPSTAFSWFPGLAWAAILCDNDASFLGFSFTEPARAFGFLSVGLRTPRLWALAATAVRLGVDGESDSEEVESDD